MPTLVARINTILESREVFHKMNELSGRNHQIVNIDTILQILNSSKNGWIYGSRLRFAHSLTLLLLFSRITSFSQLRTKLVKVIQNSQKHGLSLTAFAFLYKVGLTVLTYLKSKKNQTSKPPIPSAYDYFASGFISGYIVYGNQIPYFSNPISQQMTLYIFSRVLLGLSRLLGEQIALTIYTKQHGVSASNINSIKHKVEYRKIYNRLSTGSWSAVVAFTWGMVMVLWKYNSHVLNHSMNSSMDYIYETYSWNNFKEFFTNRGARRR